MTLKQAILSHLPQPVLNWKEKRYYRLYGEVELHLIELLCDRARDAVDVGANDGCYIHFLRPHARRVIGFEPLPYFVDHLRHKFGDSVILRPIALSNRSGEATLRVPQVNGADVTGCSSIDESAIAYYPAYREVKVRMVPLDSLKFDPAFIKIDVEGHEQAVLEGAVKTISRCQPRVLVELIDHLSPGCIHTAKAFFDKLDYQGFYVAQMGVLMPIETFDIATMQDDAKMPDLHASLKSRRRPTDYIYNFLFMPKGETPYLLPALNAKLRKVIH